MKNIVVCVDLNEDSLKTLEALKKKFDLSDAKVHFIHVFEIHINSIEFMPVVYPTPEQYPEIEKSVLSIITSLSGKMNLKAEQIEKRCFFDYSKEERINKYLKEVKAEAVVLATRGKHGIEGFFASSLADFMCKYAPCDVLVMRPTK